MSHLQQQEFVERVSKLFPEFFGEKKVLEVGSLDINGSVRHFFSNCTYIGVDIETGPGVDIVGMGQELEFDDEYFDTVISTECFEHNPFWEDTFRNMVRMSNGLVIVTAAGVGRPEHGTTRTTPQDSPFTTKIWDYYQNIDLNSFLKVLKLDEEFLLHNIEFNSKNRDLYFWGIKKSADFELRNGWHAKSYLDYGNKINFLVNEVLKISQNLVSIDNQHVSMSNKILAIEKQTRILAPLSRIYQKLIQSRFSIFSRMYQKVFMKKTSL